jgi:energy-coupling factor transport system ATP-binding protein
VSEPTLIDFQDVTYTYPTQRRRASGKEDEGEARPALRGLSLRVRRGEYLAVVGHNGSGKSTLARHCNALLVPDGGRVLVAGLDTRERAHWRAIRDQVGMVFQNPDNQIIATLVEDDVAWALAVRGMPAEEIRARVAEAMADVGISDLRGRPPHRLSGGQRQRLALAGVLALRPRCIIADEATALLDPRSRAEIVALLHRVKREHGLTVVQVTHLLEEAALADRIVVMEEGSIVLEGTPPAIFGNLERLRGLNLAIPEPIELASQLRAAGAAVSPRALTVEAIAREIAL